jgi:hypothetical protein
MRTTFSRKRAKGEGIPYCRLKHPVMDASLLMKINNESDSSRSND